jgi:hypothetical protein
MNVIVTVSHGKESTYMKAFTIDDENNITVHASRKAARDTHAAQRRRGGALSRDIGRHGVTPVAKFANRKVASERIWKAIQGLGEVAVTPDPEPEVHETEAETALRGDIVSVAVKAWGASEVGEAVADVGALAPQRAHESQGDQEDHPGQESAQGQEVRQGPGKHRATRRHQDGPGGAMLQRKNGATLAEIMERMGWQRHTVRGFVATLKKAGYTVESFRPEGGERSYRING